MPADLFGDFYIHTATIEQARPSAPPEPEDGGMDVIPPGMPGAVEYSFDDPVDSYEVDGWLTEPSGGLRLQAEAMSGVATLAHRWLMPYGEGKPSLLDHDASPAASVTHRLVGVRDEAGNIVDAGPFDITHVNNEGQQNDTIILTLHRTG